MRKRSVSMRSVTMYTSWKLRVPCGLVITSRIQITFSCAFKCFSSRISRRMRLASVRSRKVPLIFLMATLLHVPVMKSSSVVECQQRG